MNKDRIVIFLTLLVALIVVGLLEFYENKSFVQNQIANTESNWAELIKKIGPKEAYLQFSKEYENMSIEVQHTAAHYFGKVLYQEEGLEGIVACDDKFSFGCYHEFIGTAISDKGLSVSKSLSEHCDAMGSKFLVLRCKHGIGHGITAYIGYEYKDLLESLNTCLPLQTDDLIGGCYGGVFMEYNFRTMLAEQAQFREFEEHNSLYPCNILPSQFHSSCYYWQPQWWNSVLSGTEEEKYKKIASFCNPLPKNSQNDCVSGAGTIAAGISQWDPEKTIELCSMFGNNQLRLLCRTSAYDLFKSEPTKSELAEKVCGGLNSYDQQICLRKI